MAKKKRSMAEVLYGQTTPKEKEKRKGEPDKRTPAERLGKLVPIFGRLGEALSGKKKKKEPPKKKR